MKSLATASTSRLRRPTILLCRRLSKSSSRQTTENNCRNACRYRYFSSCLILVNQLLDLRKIEVNGATLMLKTGDVIQFVKDICDAFQSSMGNKVTLTFFSHVDRLVMSFDDDKVGKIMNNLLSNAFKFTEHGGRVDVSVRTVEASLSDSSENGQQLEIKVADTGKGISDEEKQHIFERFYQADNQVDNPFGGSGIGLNLVYEFVKLHGGDIRVEDNPGGGTVFILHLPVRRMEQQPQLDVEMVEQPEDQTFESVDETVLEPHIPDGDRPVVLVVDDNPMNLTVFKSLVKKTKIKVDTASSGDEGLLLTQEKKYDIIFLD
ncbi:MAG: hybrid sensor histidine kinase/response regulator, partial [Bacteroidales bacterium]|nr:hybrid sensor histidine kinase/response regulator [Bacteroidales bacterium]